MSSTSYILTGSSSSNSDDDWLSSSLSDIGSGPGCSSNRRQKNKAVDPADKKQKHNFDSTAKGKKGKILVSEITNHSHCVVHFRSAKLECVK